VKVKDASLHSVLLLLIHRVALDDSTVNMTMLKNNDSGYTSLPSPSNTPHSLYECTGFASVSSCVTFDVL
jgi:hypothetical protein